MNNIVSLSGGKDSTAMLLMMLERGEPIHSVVFFDTGWEFPQMHEHLEKLEAYIGIPIVRLKYHRCFNSLLPKYGWPNMQKRWCTSSKNDVLDKYNRKHAGTQCIGFAADEQKRTESKRLQRANGVRFPLIEYDVTEADALAYCYQHGFDWGGLYKHFSRVSCFCCPLGGIGRARKLRRYYSDLWARVLEMDSWLNPNRGYVGYDTGRALEERFAMEDAQLTMWPTATGTCACGAERSRSTTPG